MPDDTHIPKKRDLETFSILKAIEDEVQAESLVDWCLRTEYRGLVPDILEYPKENPFKSLTGFLP